MKISKIIIALSAVLSLVNCSSASKRGDLSAIDPRPSEANLTEVEAAYRAAAISNVKYALNMDMDDTGASFKADLTVDFEHKDTPHDMFLDFKNGAKIGKFTLNGKVLTPLYSQHRIVLPQSLLKVGANQVEIQYQQNYANNGRGLHRFVDPEDKRVYFYTQFEAFDAHHMFPCFDQPDIKATMKMTVKAPKAWEVITTTRETSKKADGDRVLWTFPETPRISTYLFSLHAGPYAKWKSHSGTIPLRFFARQSLKKFVVIKDWIKPTKEGLRFYGEYFAYPYPFKKYDQIIVPEFNAGAMENVAAVTFSEYFVHRSASTIKEREVLSNVILHEMAHMWFGDLVTMQWWNGLWLNESFATYMSSLAQSRVTPFKNSWITFYSRGKTGSYIEDQLVTTHPIEAKIPDTDSAFSNFDAITYGKGASVLKQLSYYIGEEAFRNGVRNYFRDHAYSNTRLADFIGELEKSSRKELKQWEKTWLEQSGVDTVEAEYSCNAEGKVQNFALKLQGPGGKASPRVHRTLVAMYQEKGGKVVPLLQQSVVYKGPHTEVPEFKGAACPVMVYPNEQDYDYAKVRLDARTLAFAKQDLSKVASNFTRIMFWPNLYSMVRDVELLPQDYLKMVMQNLPNENDMTIADAVLNSIGRVIAYLPQASDEQKQERSKIIAGLEDMLWAKIESARNSDWQKMLLGTFSDIAESMSARDRLVGLLDGKIKFKGLVIDADRRWGMIIRLSSLGDARVEPLFAKQRSLDKSSRGVSSSYAAEAIKPSLEVKKTWIGKVVDHNDLSFEQKRAVLGRMLPRVQDELRASLGDKYYSTLPTLAKSRELEFLRLYTWSLMPATCTPSSAEKLENFVSEKSSTLPTPVVKVLRIGAEEDARCVSIRAHAANAKSQ